ncbi:MAG: two-component system OmpR family sensor kinase [Lentisphaeria bacterium]
MNRAFLSLYFLIVVSVVLVGLGTDRLWQFYSPEPQVGPYESSFLQVLEFELAGLTHDQAVDKCALLSRTLKRQIELFSLEDFAQSTMQHRIASGELVSIFDSEGRKSSYQRVAQSDFIVRVTLPQANQGYRFIYIALLCVFYLVIAVVIYFWIWPLARDLSKLERHTQQVGKEGVSSIAELGQGSAVFPLAAAFNAMSQRVSALISSHKEMTYAVSHELRTPLARMKFALQMAMDTDDSAAIKKQVANVRQDVSDMEKLIHELLTYAGFEQQSQQLVLREGDIGALVEELLKVNGPQRDQASGISVSVDNRLGDCSVECDWILMERCLHNVIQNAFKFAVSKIHLQLSVEPSLLANKGLNYTVAVEDDGPGVVPADRERVFDAFVRLRNETQEKKSGFGLGLSIVRRIMRWHCGEALVNSSALGGARFVLSWPCPAQK